MNDKLFEEDLSISYLRAIAAQAQITFELRNRDDDGRDAELSKITQVNGAPFNAEFSVQLKATYSKSAYKQSDDFIKYRLKAKNYNDLCRRGTKSIILGLLILPSNVSNWVSQSAEKLILQKCMYWISLRGNKETANSSSVTVKIPKSNVLSAEQLTKMVDIIANGGEL